MICHIFIGSHHYVHPSNYVPVYNIKLNPNDFFIKKLNKHKRLGRPFVCKLINGLTIIIISKIA